MAREKYMKIVKASDSDFDKMYADMLLQFPAEEMKTREAFDSLRRDENYECCILEKDGGMAGYFCAYIAGDTSVALLDHFAIASSMHGCGLGSEALRLITARYANCKGILLEVEKPNPLDPNTLRRIKFYKSNGAYKINADYLLPGGGDSAVPMDLYFINCAGFDGRISAEEIMQTVKIVFERVHASFPNAGAVWKTIERSFSAGE